MSDVETDHFKITLEQTKRKSFILTQYNKYILTSIVFSDELLWTIHLQRNDTLLKISYFLKCSDCDEKHMKQWVINNGLLLNFHTLPCRLLPLPSCTSKSQEVQNWFIGIPEYYISSSIITAQKGMSDIW